MSASIDPAMWNNEKEMPTWPVPAEWNSAESLSKAGCVLYSGDLSPPGNKVTAILNKYGVTYKHNY